jgi:tryptophan-rich sensory protein
VVAASLVGGLITRPQIPGWYAGLVKPAFNPPNWVFGPVWTLLFALMAVAAWRILSLPPATPGRRTALLWHAGQLALNVGWSAAFFGLNSPAAGLVVVAALFGAILATMDRFRRLDPGAAWLLVPYAAWVAYAGVLNGAIWRLN